MWDWWSTKWHSEYFGFPFQFSFHEMLDSRLSSGAGTIGQLVTDVPNGLSLTPPHEIKKKYVLISSAEFRTRSQFKDRLSKMWTSFDICEGMLRNQNYIQEELKKKLRSRNAYCPLFQNVQDYNFTSLRYGCETWSVTRGKKIVFGTRVLRRVEKVTEGCRIYKMRRFRICIFYQILRW
jgi:hypothetical protein